VLFPTSISAGGSAFIQSVLPAWAIILAANGAACLLELKRTAILIPNQQPIVGRWRAWLAIFLLQPPSFAIKILGILTT
jgi:hypothetical protein